MKRIIALLSCTIVFCNCHKELPVSNPPAVENSDQKLTTIVNTLIINGSLLASDSLTFTYDDAGKMISEGTTHYYRDDKERIVRITVPLIDTITNTSYVFYSDAKTGKINYVCNSISGTGCTDSLVYLHNEGGKVYKIMLYYFFQDRDSFVLVNYFNFDYDDNGNIKQIVKHALDVATNNFITCWALTYSAYDNKINPLHSGDEVRLLDYFWGLSNVSANNVTHTGHNNYNEQYEYREDGRPRLCRVYESGKEIYKSFYYYK